MAIISFTNYKHGQTIGSMGVVMRYTMQNKKNVWENQKLSPELTVSRRPLTATL